MVDRSQSKSTNGLPSRWYTACVVTTAVLFLSLAWVGFQIVGGSEETPLITPFQLQVALAISIVAGVATLFPSRLVAAPKQADETSDMVAQLTGLPVLASVYEKAPLSQPATPKRRSGFVALVLSSEFVVALAIVLTAVLYFTDPKVAEVFVANPVQGFVEVVHQTKHTLLGFMQR